MKISDLKPGQFVIKSGKKYEYQGVKKVRGIIGVTQKFVFQGDKPEDKLLYPLPDGTKTLEQEKISIIPAEKKLFYRLANNQTEQGLWYDFKGNFTGMIHNEFSFCKNSELPMPFNMKIQGWLSATDKLEDLFIWFPEEDILKLEDYGYRVSVYEAVSFEEYENHWIINQGNSKLIEQHLLSTIKERKLYV